MAVAVAPIAAGEELTFQLEGVFDGVAARRLEAALASASPADRLNVDLTHVREFHDFGVAILGQALARTRAAVEVRGLRRHQLRVLRFFGVDAGPAERALQDDRA
jgi:anti-anti-sigma regulatory factor